jgi:hypothetical protein
MPQHDYVIANDTAANVRADINNALAAIVSNNSGSTAPATTYANQWWYDTTTGLLKRRSAANDAWIVIGPTSATGSAVIPSGTDGQRDGSPSAGYFRFNTTLGKFEGYSGTAWGSVGGGATGGGSDDLFIENGQTMTTNYTIPSTKNAMSTGPITINSGVTLTVSSGARYVVL